MPKNICVQGWVGTHLYSKRDVCIKTVSSHCTVGVIIHHQQAILDFIKHLAILSYSAFFLRLAIRAILYLNKPSGMGLPLQDARSMHKLN